MISAKHKRSSGFTLIELVVIVAILIVLALLWIPAQVQARRKAQRISCVGNLKHIGTAYRVWMGDHNDLFPSQSTNGWGNLSTTTNLGSIGWTNYLIMANELGQSPRVLACPSDERKPADLFPGFGGTTFDNRNVSYFVGLFVDESRPEALLGGDRNLGPGPTPRNDYGYSPANNAGADVIISTNSSRTPLVWSLKMHSAGNPIGTGNLLLANGSVQQCTSARLRTDFQSHAGSWLTNGAGSNALIRLVFP